MIINSKNFLKSSLDQNSKIYRWLRFIYRKVVFPIERARYLTKRGISHKFTDSEELHMCALLPRQTLDIVISSESPTSWLDVGCGMGAALNYVIKSGIAAEGIELSSLAIEQSGLRKVIHQLDLTEPIYLEKQFDVVWCYEVAEHLESRFANQFLENLCRHGNFVVFSAATPGQGGDGHVNEQPPTYWIDKMKDLGFDLDEELTNKAHLLNELYSGNVLCFRRKV